MNKLQIRKWMFLIADEYNSAIELADAASVEFYNDDADEIIYPIDNQDRFIWEIALEAKPCDLFSEDEEEQDDDILTDDLMYEEDIPW